MDQRPHDDPDARAERTTRVIGHLDGALDAHMLEAMSGVWSTLEHAATTGPAHARAVRERLFWESLRPGGAAAAPGGDVVGLAPTWHGDEAFDADFEADAA